MSCRTLFRFAVAIVFAACSGLAGAQAIDEGFDNITTLSGVGWFFQNNSQPAGILPNWFQGTNVAANGPFDAFDGAANAYIAVNYNSVSGANTISQWMLTPNRTFRNGDVITFYTRRPTPNPTEYPDRLEVRLSTNGASTNVGTGSAAVGDFTTLLLSINPTLVTNVYPATWTQFTVTISGLPAPTSGRVGFRYFVTNGGPTGANSDYIGIDRFVYTPYVCPVITVSPATVPGGTYSTAYSQSLSQTGALGTPSFAVTAGALPPGMTLSAAGSISGAPTATGTFNFTVTASDASGCSGSRPYSITVVAQDQTITFPAQAGQVYSPGGTFAIDPLATASSNQAVTYDSATPLVCTVSGTTVTIVSAGTCSITADQAGDPGGINPAPQVTQDVVIAQAAQTLTFPSQPVDMRELEVGTTFAIDPLASSATPNSGEPITYSSLTPAVCTVTGTTVTMVSEGTCEIAANQAGNANYAAAAQLSVDVRLVVPTEADLAVVKTVNQPTATIGQTVVYTLVVSNAGPADAPNVNVLDLAPARLDPASVAWECVAATGTVCPTPDSDTGDLDANVALPEDASLTFEVVGQVDPAANPVDDFTSFDNTATVSLLPGSGLTDPVPGNNSDTASVQVQPLSIFKDGFED